MRMGTNVDGRIWYGQSGKTNGNGFQLNILDWLYQESATYSVLDVPSDSRPLLSRDGLAKSKQCVCDLQHYLIMSAIKCKIAPFFELFFAASSGLCGFYFFRLGPGVIFLGTNMRKDMWHIKWSLYDYVTRSTCRAHIYLCYRSTSDHLR